MHNYKQAEYDNYISLSIGLSTYKPIHFLVYEGNVFFHLSQSIYLMTGLAYFDNVKYSSPDATIQYDLFANLYLLKRWQFNTVFSAWAGIGITPSFGYTSANFLLKFDVSVSNSSNLGLLLKQEFLITKKAPNYLRSPILLINYTIKL